MNSRSKGLTQPATAAPKPDVFGTGFVGDISEPCARLAERCVNGIALATDQKFGVGRFAAARTCRQSPVIVGRVGCCALIQA